MTGFNETETKKMGAWLASIGVTVTDDTGTILHHARAPYSGPSKWVDNEGNTHTVQFNHYHIYYEAGTNLAGVGDGKEPKVAMTYSMGINLGVRTHVHRTRKYNDYDNEVYRFYAYSRTLEGLQNKVYRYLMAR